MALGYQRTGYTEPFFTPVAVVSTTALNTVDYSGMGAGIVAIEYTEYKNAHKHCVAKGAQTATTILTGYNSLDVNDVVTNDGGTTYFTVTAVKTLPIKEIADNVQNNLTEQEVTFNASITVTDGQVLNVVGRVVDVGSTTASVSYDIGEKILEPYVA